MTILDKIIHATRPNINGQVKLLKKIGEGANASVYRGFLIQRKTIKVIKRIHLVNSGVYAKIAWKKAGWINPRKSVKFAPYDFIIQLEGRKQDLTSDKDHCITRILSTAKPIFNDGAIVLLQCTEFVTEVAVGYCLNDHVNIYLPSPTFCHFTTAWCSTKYGNIAMENAGISLLDGMNDLSLEELQSIVYQVLVALSWAQNKVHFKHHDLHTGNIFYKRKNVFKEWTTPNHHTIELPSTCVQACIADYGMSAATDPSTKIRHGRIDYDLMSTRQKGWGTFNSELKTNEGYDAIVMFSHLEDDSDLRSHNDWLKKCLKSIRSLHPSKLVISSKGRPLSSVIMTPEDILLEIFLKPAIVQLQKINDLD